MRAADTSAEPWWEGPRQVLDAPRVPQLRSPIDFRLVVDQSLSLIVITDARGRIEYVSPRFTQVTGYQWFEIVGKLIADFGGPPPEEEARMWEALTSGREWRGEFEIPTKGGDSRWLSASVSPVKAPDGTITHYIGVNLDITESRRAEESLRESEEKFRRLAESVPAGTFIFQGPGFRFVNTAMEKMLGYTAEEMARMNFWDTVHPDFQEMVKARGLARLRGEEVPSQYEVKFIRKGGEVRWGLVTASQIEYEGALAAIGTIMDITEHKVAEEALSASEEKFRMLAETIPVATFIVQGTRLRFTNPAMEGVFGYTPSEFATRQFWDLVHPDYHDVVRERGMARQRGEEVPSQTEVKFVTKCGEARWGLCTAHPIEFDGDPAVIGTIVDITESKAAEEAVRASEEKFRALAETHPASTFITQGDRFRFVNKAMQQALGYSEAELLELNFWSAVHPDFADLVKERAWARQRGEDVPGEYEIKYVTKSGETRWGLVSAAPIEYQGAPAILGGILDITESKIAEESLRASEEKFRMQAETVPAATFIVQGTRLRFANSTAEAMLGYTREELLNMNFYDFIHPDMKGLAKDRGLARQRGEDVPSQYEIRFVTRDGEERWGIITAARMQYDGERAMIGSVIDITERRVGEAALRASEERYRMLYQDNPSMYFTLCEGLTVLAVNKHGAEELGYEPGELVGEPVLGVVHPGDRSSVRRQLTALLKDDVGRQDLEFRKVRKNGEVIWVKEAVQRAVDANGKTILLVVCEDITERRRTEETLQRLREDLERKAERVLGKGNPYDLSFRELTVLHLVVNGRSDKEIAVTLGIRPLTVSKHVANVLKKMRAASRTEAGVRAWREGLIE